MILSGYEAATTFSCGKEICALQKLKLQTAFRADRSMRGELETDASVTFEVSKYFDLYLAHECTINNNPIEGKSIL